MKYLSYGLVMLLCIGCNRTAFTSRWTKQEAPATYIVRFETSKGQFDVQVNREWSPLAADRFYQLVVHRTFDNSLFYRVYPDFVAQFGSSDSAVMEKWMRYKIPDEPVLYGNKKGSLSFARSGPESRGSDLFINLKDNPRLDTLYYEGVKGFPCFGDVINGMEVVSALYSAYGDKTMGQLDLMYKDRGQFLQSFPGLDIIRKAFILKK